MRLGTVARLVLVLLLAVSLRASAQGIDDPEPQADEFVTLARWYGEMSGTGRVYASHEPAGWDFSPNSAKTSSIRVVIREEVNKATGEERAVVESLSWSSTIGDLYYRQLDGSKVAAGSGGSGSGSHSESDLIGDVVPPSPEHRESLENQIREAEVRVQEARRKVGEAEADSAAPPAPADPAAPPADDDLGAQLQQAGEEYQAVVSRADATPEERRQALKKLRDLTLEFQKRAEELQATQKRLQAEMDKQLAVLNDPQASEAQREAAMQDLERLQQELEAETHRLIPQAQARDTERARQRELEEAQWELEAAERDLRAAQEALHRAETRRNPRASAEARVHKREGKVHASISFFVEDDSLLEYDADITPLEHVGLETRLKTSYPPTKIRGSLPRMVKMGFSAHRPFDDDKNIVIEESEEYQSGEPGLIGGGEASWKVRFRRVAVDQQLIVRGSVLHRIRATHHENEDPFILTDGRPGSLEGSLPVQGAVLVEAWVRDAGAAIVPGEPADVVAHTSDGRFELALPMEPDKLLRLAFTYANATAQLKETVTLSVRTDDILSARGEISGRSGAVGLEEIYRIRSSFTRYERELKEYPLSIEARGATVRREQGQTFLQFEGFNSILINTFILDVPHLNQNLQAFSVRAKVPAQRLLEISPNVLRSVVAQRMGVPVESPPAETVTDVFIPGWSICHPTSVCMTLAGMGLLELDIREGRSEEVGRLAQGVYDTHALSKPPPWLFPFLSDPSAADAAAAAATQQWTQAMKTGDFRGLKAAFDALKQATAAYADWPFREPGVSDVAKRWLVNIDVFRPWQHDAPLIAHLERMYGERITAATRNEDLFDPSNGRLLSNHLGGGNGGVISFSHLDSNRGRGGHLVAVVGVVIDADGSIVRTIVHDPWGDQTQNPSVEGYYHHGKPVDRSKYDTDRTGHRGAYAPYRPQINSYQGSLKGNRWIAVRHATPLSSQSVAARLLPSEQWDEKLSQ